VAEGVRGGAGVAVMRGAGMRGAQAVRNNEKNVMPNTQFRLN